jgi:hypothetical protein
MENWKRIYTTDQAYKADLVKAYLANEDIEAVIFNKKDSAYIIFGEVDVYVQPEDENLATELIKAKQFE